MGGEVVLAVGPDDSVTRVEHDGGGRRVDARQRFEALRDGVEVRRLVVEERHLAGGIVRDGGVLERRRDLLGVVRGLGRVPRRGLVGPDADHQRVAATEAHWCLQPAGGLRPGFAGTRARRGGQDDRPDGRGQAASLSTAGDGCGAGLPRDDRGRVAPVWFHVRRWRPRGAGLVGVPVHREGGRSMPATTASGSAFSDPAQLLNAFALTFVFGLAVILLVVVLVLLAQRRYFEAAERLGAPGNGIAPRLGVRDE